MNTKKTTNKQKRPLGFIFIVIFLLLIGAIYLNNSKRDNKNTNTSSNKSSTQPYKQSQAQQWINYQNGNQINN